MEALAGLLGAVIGGILVLVGDFGRRWADTRQSQVQRLANAAVEFSVPIAHLVADIRDARDRHEPTARIPSRGSRRVDTKCILEVAKLPDDDPNVDQVLDEYFDAQIALEQKVRSIIQRGRIKSEEKSQPATKDRATS